MGISPITKQQWVKVAKAVGFSFSAAFIGTMVTAGGLTTSTEANIALLHSSTVAGFNALLYAGYLLFQNGS